MNRKIINKSDSCDISAGQTRSLSFSKAVNKYLKQSSTIWLVNILAKGGTLARNQIAVLFGIKKSSVHSLLFRARKYLKNHNRKLQLIYDAELKVYRIIVSSKNYNIRLENQQSHDDNVVLHHMTVVNVQSLNKKRKIFYTEDGKLILDPVKIRSVNIRGAFDRKRLKLAEEQNIRATAIHNASSATTDKKSSELFRKDALKNL